MNQLMMMCCSLLLALLLPSKLLHAIQFDDSHRPATTSQTWAAEQADSSKQSKDATFSFALSAGLYRPRLSSNPAAEQLFRTIFVQKQTGYLAARAPLLTLEGAWYPFATSIKLGLLLQLQYWTLGGKAIVCKDAANEYSTCNKDDLSNIQVGEDTTSINFLPIAIGLIYRADMLIKAGIAPLFGLVKATINNGFWWSTVGPYQGIRSARKILGHTLYYNASLGLGYVLPQTKMGPTQTLDSAITLEAVSTFGNAPHQSNNLDWTDTAYVYAMLGVVFDF